MIIHFQTNNISSHYLGMQLKRQFKLLAGNCPRRAIHDLAERFFHKILFSYSRFNYVLSNEFKNTLYTPECPKE